MRTATCCLCAQIEGRAENDLIARLLPRQTYLRRVLLDSAGFAAIPSLGPLVPGHALLCPRAHVRSFADLAPALHDEFERVRGRLSNSLQTLYPAEIHMFEHGMGGPDARVVCTVDHAHLHLLPLPAGIDLQLDRDLDGRWTRFDGTLPALHALSGRDEYLYYRAPGGEAWMLTTRGLPIASQHLRRLVAARIGRPEKWDWRTTPDAEAADLAWRRFALT
jgi:diadenosine tetraphosphate (Ap4A) HIT family hydrolase